MDPRSPPGPLPRNVEQHRKIAVEIREVEFVIAAMEREQRLLSAHVGELRELRAQLRALGSLLD
jgi:hypothetical protein